jgi:hypothetical protein
MTNRLRSQLDESSGAGHFKLDRDEQGRVTKVTSYQTLKPGEEPDATAFEQHIRKHFPQLGPMTLTQQPALPYGFSLQGPGYKIANDLRSPAKTLLTYLRHLGADIDPADDLLQFVRGASVSHLPVVAPQSEVLNFGQRGQNECMHTIAVLAVPEESCAVVYLDLFSSLDCVGIVRLASPPAFDIWAYRYDLISAAPVSQEFRWTVAIENVRSWINQGLFPADRLKNRASSLGYWLQNRPSVWISRASSRAGRAFFYALDDGADHAAAEKAPIEEMQQYMRSRGWELEIQLTFTPAEGSPQGNTKE